MRLTISDGGTPIIHLDGHNRIIFSDTVNKNVGGYKYLCVTARVREVIKKKKQRGTNEVTREAIFCTRGFMTNTVLSDLDTEAKEVKIIKEVLPYIKKTLIKYVREDGIFPYEAIKLLEGDIDSLNQQIMEARQKLEEKKQKKAETIEKKAAREAKKKEKELLAAERLQKKLIRAEKLSQREMRRQQREAKKK
jgi:hypothetical protein